MGFRRNPWAADFGAPGRVQFNSSEHLCTKARSRSFLHPEPRDWSGSSGHLRGLSGGLNAKRHERHARLAGRGAGPDRGVFTSRSAGSPRRHRDREYRGRGRPGHEHRSTRRLRATVSRASQGDLQVPSRSFATATGSLCGPWPGSDCSVNHPSAGSLARARPARRAVSRVRSARTACPWRILRVTLTI